MREKLIELLAKYFDIGDSYAYNLTRDKHAFVCGTMGFDDFEEFDEETVSDIADHLIANGVTIPVLCKDCKNALTNIPKPLVADPKKPVCTKWINWRTVEPDHFCSYGERRTDDA